MSTNDTENGTSAAVAATTEAVIGPWITNAGSINALGPIKDLLIKNVYMALGSIGMVGNLFVVVVMALCTGDTKHKLTKVLIVNQSIIDMLASTMMILSAVDQTPNNMMDKYSARDQFVCRIWLPGWPLWGLLQSSTYSIAALGVERFIAIVHPIYYKTKIASSRNAAFVFVAVSFSSGLLFQLLWNVPSSDIIDSTCYALSVWNVSIEARKTVGFVIFVFQYFFPVAVMIYCYGRIFHVIQSKVTPDDGTSTNRGDATANGGGDVYKKVRRNVLRTSATVFIGFLLCNTWNEFFILLFNLGRPTDFTGWFYRFTVIAAFANCCVNPIIYIVQYKEFQRGLQRLFRGLRLVVVGETQPAGKEGTATRQKAFSNPSVASQ